MQTVPRRILIVRPSALGDVCRTVPVLWSLRAAFPSATIDWVVEDTWSDAIRFHPALDSAIPFPKRALAAFWRHPRALWQAVQWGLDLRRRRYDLVIDAQGLARSGLMSLVSGASVRVGHRRAHEFSWLGATLRVEGADSGHTVDRMLRLVEAIGVAPQHTMDLSVGAAHIEWWLAQRASRTIDRPYAVFATANKWEGKRWISSRWHALVASIAGDLIAAGIHDLIWIGGPSERGQVADNTPDATSIAPLRSHDLSSETTVGGMMAIVKDAALVVSLDSAPAHLAVGFNTPLVALYGATSVATDGPYKQAAWCARGGSGDSPARHDYRDSARGSALMARIGVDEVASLIRARLQVRAKA